MEYIVETAQAGNLLREDLRKRLHLSRALLTELKQKENGITVGGISVTVRYVLREGDCVSLAVEDTKADEDPFLTPSDLPVRILYEDEYVLAVDKPPYMPTHPSHRHRDDTLANALKAEFDRRGRPFVFRAVNRLDADTSGIVLVAKDRFSAERFAKTNPDLHAEKRYIAFCEGELPQTEFEICGYIRRAGESIILRVPAETGTPSEFAHTRFRVTETVGGISVVECTPVTGRTHQLRVHLASVGHPIVGDDLYGGSRALPRQALHAARLTFTHPFTGVHTVIESPLPADLAEFLNQKRKSLP